MSEIDASVEQAGYAVFALQQPLSLDRLAEATGRAELPLAGDEPPDETLLGSVDAPRPYGSTMSPEHVDHLLTRAPELGGPQAEPLPHRRASDPEPID